MWGCGLRPHPHIYPSLRLAGGLFSALIHFVHRLRLYKPGSPLGMVLFAMSSNVGLVLLVP